MTRPDRQAGARAWQRREKTTRPTENIREALRRLIALDAALAGRGLCRRAMADRFHVHVKTIQRDHDLLRAVTGDRGVCRRAEEGSYRRRHSKPRWRYSKPRRRVFCRWLEAKATPRLEGRPESKSSLRPWTGDTFSGGRIVLTCYCGIKRAADQAVRMRGMWGWRVNGRKWPKRVKGGWEVVASQPE